MQFRTKSKKDLGMDMTPIIDTVFNLLIFFALSLNFITSPGIQVKLPRASVEQFPTERTEVVVAITKEGSLFLDQQRTTLSALYEKLERMTPESKEKGLVIIQGDEKALHGMVVEVLDAVKRAGWARLAIATQPEEKGKPR